MPSLGSHLNFNQLEARNATIHNLSAAPSAPVKGQMYYDTTSNTLMWFDGTAWQSAKGGVTAPPDASTSAKGVVQLANDLGGTATAPTVLGLHLAADTAINHKLTALTDPTNPQEAATKNYVDGKVGGGGPPVGAAGGDLTGSYPNPTVAALAITDAKVAAANKDGAAATPSLRTLGGNPSQALPGNAALSDLRVPTIDVDFNSHKAIGIGTPTNPGDATNKNYVDSVVQGLDAKQSCKACSQANNTLSGAQTIDGVSVVAGDRVLVSGQSTLSQNGIYVVASGAWTRATDMDSWTEVPGAFTWVEQGTNYGDTGWVCTADQGGTLGTTNILWSQFSGPSVIAVGNGLQKSGNYISINNDGLTIDAGGAGGSLEVMAGGITGTQLAAGAVNLAGTKVTGSLPVANGGTGATTSAGARSSLNIPGAFGTSTHGAGTTITIPKATHGLQGIGAYGRAIHVQVQDNTTGNIELPDVSVALNGDVTVTYAVSVAANSKLITLVG